MMQKYKIFPLLALFSIYVSAIFGKTDKYQEYIDRYSALAIEHRERFNIPAAITMAQGLLESGAGQSTLAKKGNNHFGIKCHSDWTGDTLRRNDDAPLECFRAYATPEESFLDHSRFLCRGRYLPLFNIPVEDYAGWARGLKKCGYATDPQYAERLIAIIERYSLYRLDSDSHDPSAGAEFILASLKQTHPVRKNRGLYYIIANPGDTYSSLAEEFKLPLNRLLDFNDASADDPVRDWTEVYLQKKLTSAPKGMKNIMAGEGETMRTVAQRLGMQLDVLRKLNPGKSPDDGGNIRLR